MSDLLQAVRLVLEEANYRCWIEQSDSVAVMAFEDNSVMGFVFEFPSANAILEDWRTTEDGILRRAAAKFKNSGEKAWNVYCCFLAVEDASDDDRRRLRRIEEDLAQTRKLAAAVSIDRESVRQALLPLLPFSSRPRLEAVDVEERLARRLDALAPGVSNLVLDSESSSDQVLEHLRSCR